ncbi:ZPR1 zinc-finger domain-containing protein [Peziza echinospora]|nr:ZPR1 zinc-finger domain-containing protein [Peziza echinospora]
MTATGPATTTTAAADMFQNIGAAVDTVAGQDENSAIDEPSIVDNIESLCMNCEEQGVTRLLLTRIPFFREVVLMSFSCPHCHYRNSEIQSAGQIQERGTRYTFYLTNTTDLNRQLVKSETCVTRIPELDLEIPAQRGQLTNVEGLLTVVAEDLASDQAVRIHTDPEGHAKIESFIARIKACLGPTTQEGDENAATTADDKDEKLPFPFTIILDDPAGNSWIEPRFEDKRGKWERADYLRSPEQNERLGLTDTSAHDTTGGEEQQEITDIKRDEVHTFPATCPSCTRPCSTFMKFVNIPHFKEVIIMSTVCEDCGYKSNEVKTGGAVPPEGTRITLNVTHPDDLARDILKSETCALTCPELNLDLTPGTLGGRFTTLEGLLTQVHDDLHSRIFSSLDDSTPTDSVDLEARERWKKFFEGLLEAKDGKRKFTVILEDPMGASYLQNLFAPDKDPEMEVVSYKRTHEQEEELGLLDMVTEGYEQT